MSTPRRSFLKKSALVAAGVPFAGPAAYRPAFSATSSEFTEPARQVPVAKETEVIVCGGGPAGIAAAMASARQGAHTTLLEMQGCLGGVWTSGLLSNLIDHQNKSGIMQELVTRLDQSDAQYSAKVYDAEFMKWLLDQMCLEAGVHIRLHTRCVAAYRNAENRLACMVSEGFSGREAWKAKIFIDTTGNGDLGAQAGCHYDLGHPETGKAQPASLMAILVGLDETALVENGLTRGKGRTSEAAKRAFYQEIQRAGLKASYTMPTLFAVRPGMIAMMANHQYGMSVLDGNQVTRATLEARQEVNQIVDGLRALGGIWSHVRIAATAAQIGIREGRRLQGLYTLTSEDLIRGARFPDAVCRVTFNVDVHSLDKKAGGAYGSHSVRAKPYDIPLRSLIAKDVEGLMMAGRCISGDFFAHASYRVTGNAVAMGEVAGRVAAQAARENKRPQDVAVSGP